MAGSVWLQSKTEKYINLDHVEVIELSPSGDGGYTATITFLSGNQVALAISDAESLDALETHLSAVISGREGEVINIAPYEA